MTKHDASSHRYQNVVEQLSEFIVRWQPGGMRTFVNGAYCRHFGKSREELLGTSFFSLIGDDDRERVLERLNQLTPDQPSSEGEHRVLHADGSVSWHHWHDVALFDDEGNVVEYQSVGRDITPQKLAEAELEERLNFETLLSSISMDFMNVTPENFDDHVCRSLAALREHLDVADISYYQFSKDMNHVECIQSHTAEGTKHEFWPIDDGSNDDEGESPDYDIRRSSCRWLWDHLTEGLKVVVNSVADLPDEAVAEKHAWGSDERSRLHLPLKATDTVLGFLYLESRQSGRWTAEQVRQIEMLGRILATAMMRERVDHQLRESERRFRTLAENAPIGIFRKDGEGNCLDTNKVCSEITGRSHEQLRNGKWIDAIHVEDRERATRAWQRSLSLGVPMIDMEYRFVHTNGDIVWVRTSVVPQRDDDDNVIGWIGSLLDTTGQRESMERVRTLRRQVAIASRLSALGELTASIAHELNQPLTAIGANVSTAQRILIRSSTDTSDLDEILTDIASDNQRAAEIIRNMRALVKQEPLKLASVDVNQLVSELVRVMDLEATQRNAEIMVQLAPELPPTLGNANQLQQVLVNLVTNGLDAMSDTHQHERQLTISTEQSGTDQVAVTVLDNGPGFEPSAAEHVFTPLVSSKSTGLGLGLSICRRIIEAHGGTITVANREQSGAKVRFTIPLTTNVV